MTTNVFKELNDVNVSNKIERKGSLSYLSWAWAWAELKKKYPLATSKVYEREDGRIYWDDGLTAWVKCSVTIMDLEHIEYLPIMDFKNKSMKIGSFSSFEVNKAIQRAITKAISRHGLGLYIYAGEDLPEESDGKQHNVKITDTSNGGGGRPFKFKPSDKQLGLIKFLVKDLPEEKKEIIRNSLLNIDQEGFNKLIENLKAGVK